MTMPHLENCIHKDDGWCLDCIKELGKENLKFSQAILKLSRIIKELGEENESLRQAILEVSRITFEQTSQGADILSIAVKHTDEDVTKFQLANRLVNEVCKRWLI